MAKRKKVGAVPKVAVSTINNGNLREHVREMVRSMIATEVASALADFGTLAKTAIGPVSEPEPESHTPESASHTRSASGGKYYRSRLATHRELRGNFRTVLNSLIKRDGQTKREIMDDTGMKLKSVESAIYGLQQMGLVGPVRRD